jgi:N utilization substance protein B
VSARGKARKRAVDVLYSAELRGVSPLVTLAEGPMGEGAAGTVPVPHPYLRELVEGVVAHQERIDELLGTYSHGWALDRMPAVDRNILRVAVFELLWNEAVPPAVAIDEAVALAHSLSTDESPAFVNGLLARILELKPRLAV